ncbi:MAG: hypothetical protein WD317_01905 [Balneolaceae bacterium]
MANEKEKKEGKIAEEIEERTAQIPSDAYLWTAVSLMGLSLTLKLLQKDDVALFVGQWPAPILIMGVYNKIVKTQGSD